MEKTKRRKWMGSPIRAVDDFGYDIHDVFIDGRTKGGPWAVMSPAAHAKYGVGLGDGKGQRYQREDGDWYKVEG